MARLSEFEFVVADSTVTHNPEEVELLYSQLPQQTPWPLVRDGKRIGYVTSISMTRIGDDRIIHGSARITDPLYSEQEWLHKDQIARYSITSTYGKK